MLIQFEDDKITRFAAREVRPARGNKRFRMETRKLGNSDIKITRVGFGAWALGGGGWEFAWGPQNDADSIAAIHRALDLGVNWIDTAAVYGLGHSEEVVARALKEWRGPRPYVFTKCVLVWNEKGTIWRQFSPASIRSLQPPYSIIRRQIEAETLPYCKKQVIGVISYAPMASGLLTGAMTRERAATLPPDDFRTRNPEFREPRLSKNIELVERLRKVGARHGRMPGEVAISWTLRYPAITGAIVGARNAKQSEGVMRAGELKLTTEEIAEIEGARSEEHTSELQSRGH